MGGGGEKPQSPPQTKNNPLKAKKNLFLNFVKKDSVEARICFFFPHPPQNGGLAKKNFPTPWERPATPKIKGNFLGGGGFLKNEKQIKHPTKKEKKIGTNFGGNPYQKPQNPPFWVQKFLKVKKKTRPT